jgi:hypothetical protein
MRSSSRQHRHSALCGPDCRYRTLYEGTQSSLADMASKNAIALNRVGRLRQGVVLLLKSHVPRRFADLESHLGMRLSEVDDESLLSCVQWLLEQERDETLLGELRASLEQAGYRVRSTDGLAEIIRAVSDGPAGATASPRPPYAAFPDAFRPRLTVAEAAAIAARNATANAPAPEELPAAPAAQPPEAGQKPSATDPTLTELFDDPTTQTPPPTTEPTTEPATAPTPPLPAPPAATSPGEGGPPSAPQTDVVDDDPDLASAAAPPTEAEHAGEEPDQSVTPKESPPGKAEVPSPDDAVPATPRPSRVVRGAPLRPELFPSAGRSSTLPVRQRRKRSRVTAAAPLDAATAAAPPPAPDDGLDGRLLAAVSVPRPVFVSDLAELAGSGTAVEAWIERCRSADESSLRFIPPKQRHRLRGSLVLPTGALRDTATEFDEAWWAECMAKFRGAKLYELAVLLHAVGDRVVSWRVAEDRSTVLLRINEPRGVVGVIVVLGDQLDEGGAARSQLVADMEELLRDRLALMAVVVTAEPLLDPVTAVLAAEAAERGWSPSCHVVAARSWEWATGNAAAARHVLG